MVYLETCACPTSTLARPDVGATRGIATTAMGRAWLAAQPAAEQRTVMAALAQERPDEWKRCRKGIEESLAQYAKRGFALNLGDAGLGVVGAGVHSRMRYGQRTLVFNCAMPGLQWTAARLSAEVGPALVELVRRIEQQAGMH